MLEALKRFLDGRGQTEVAPVGPSRTTDPVQVAACALLLELAHADGEFSQREREYLENALGRHFGLDAEALQSLMVIAETERAKSIDHFTFTREITRHYDIGQKVVLAEVMWGVILADGELAQDEAYLIRKLANLLDLPPAYLSEARHRAKGSE